MAFKKQANTFENMVYLKGSQIAVMVLDVLVVHVVLVTAVRRHDHGLVLQQTGRQHNRQLIHFIQHTYIYYFKGSYAN